MWRSLRPGNTFRAQIRTRPTTGPGRYQRSAAANEQPDRNDRIVARLSRKPSRSSTSCAASTKPRFRAESFRSRRNRYDRLRRSHEVAENGGCQTVQRLWFVRQPRANAIAHDDGAWATEDVLCQAMAGCVVRRAVIGVTVSHAVGGGDIGAVCAGRDGDGDVALQPGVPGGVVGDPVLPAAPQDPCPGTAEGAERGGGCDRAFGRWRSDQRPTGSSGRCCARVSQARCAAVCCTPSGTSRSCVCPI